MNSPRVTFRGNLAHTRHGWLRLTPAYSVQLVEELVAQLPSTARVLDPFCGSGTTLLTCAERGLACATVDLNPFLVWLANAKASAYSPSETARATALVERMAGASQRATRRPAWTPPLSNIQRWWDDATLAALAQAFGTLKRARQPAPVRDLAKISFCRAMIASANVSFGHQSMSFGRGAGEPERVAELLLAAAQTVGETATETLEKPQPGALIDDSRRLSALRRRRFDAVVTSPPYCNRMSYIRELRPYMYWLGHLERPANAGELDWQAIGGTWGIATSRLNRWHPTRPALRNDRRLLEIVRAIAQQSQLLSRYVHRYFCDMAEHLGHLVPRLGRGATLHYVIGNSKFYDVVLPTERLLAAQMKEAGLTNVRVRTLRTRSSKAELFEYLVTAVKT